MAFFTDMKRSLTEAGKQVAQKTKEVSDTVQLKTQISREEKTSNDLYPERLEAEERGAESSPDLSEHDL